jgi:hypothetical protein
MSTYFSIVSEMVLGKTKKKYTDNPMTTKMLADVPVDDTYIIVKNVVDKVSDLIAQPYDYIKQYIITKNEDEHEDKDEEDEIVFNEILINKYNLEESGNSSEEMSLVTISYDTIYKADDAAEQTDDNIDTFVKTAATAYTFVVSTYNDVIT